MGKISELLAEATAGDGVTWATLDALRSDIQEVMHLKRQAHIAKAMLQEREHHVASLNHELRTNCLPEMEAKVARTKSNVKSRLATVQKGDGGSLSTQWFARSASSLASSCVKAEGMLSQSRRRHAELLEECDWLKQATIDHRSQKAVLQEKYFWAER